MQTLQGSDTLKSQYSKSIAPASSYVDLLAQIQQSFDLWELPPKLK